MILIEKQYQHFLSLSLFQVCLIECEGNVSPASTWDLCRKASALQPLPSISVGGAMLKRAQEEVEALLSEDEPAEGGVMQSDALQRFDHVARALGVDERSLQSRTSQLNAAYNAQNALSMEEDSKEERGQEDGDGDIMERGQGEVGLSVSKRFGGFWKGRHGYKKLVSPGRPFQKRYGGFIGVRKSARKWNNQKRFSEFLKQYLGMSTRATEFNSVSEDLTQQNEV